MRTAAGSLGSESSKWDSMRRQARTLENEIDAKLVSLNNLGNSVGDAAGIYGGSSSKDNLLHSGEQNMALFETKSAELGQLLNDLEVLNDKMNDYVNVTMTTPSGSVHHNLQRHREICTNYGHELRKIRSSVTASREREDLIPSIHRMTKEYREGNNQNRSVEDMYAQEQARIQSSNRLADQAIDIALSTRDQLLNQRNMFTDIQGRVLGVGQRFPQINSLMKKITAKQRKDAMILGVVISICIIILYLYIF
eukprot:Nk52_evm48s1737 gene=Nk52_evmTU48s1737